MVGIPGRSVNTLAGGGVASVAGVGLQAVITSARTTNAAHRFLVFVPMAFLDNPVGLSNK
jgi:hypothetical protein